MFAKRGEGRGERGHGTSVSTRATRDEASNRTSLSPAAKPTLARSQRDSMKHLLLVLALCFLTSPAQLRATEFFVGKKGFDGNAGDAAPLATIQTGVSILKAGDTLTILPGEYFEAVE